MKRVTLTPNEQARLNVDSGGLAQSLAVREYTGWKPVGGRKPWDLERESGAIADVKACLTRLGNGNRGRFRLWEDQHSRLTRTDRAGTGRYVFVLFDTRPSTPIAYLKEQKPASIGRVVAGRGGFNRAGHADRDARSHKLPWRYVFPERYG